MRQNRNSDKGMAMPLEMVLAVLLFVMCMCVTGCGGNATRGGINAGVNRGVSEGAVSGGAVSGTAVITDSVSEGAVKGKSNTDGGTTGSAKKYRYSTDTNQYYTDINATHDYYCIMQARLDGTCKKEIWNNEYECYLHYVSEDWLYYEFEKEDEYILYRAPIEKDAEGYDVINKSGKEELLRGEGGVNFSFWDYPYMIYDDGWNIVKYDLRKKEKVCEYPYADEDESTEENFTEFKFFRLGDRYVAFKEWDIDRNVIFSQEVDGTEWKSCGDENSWIGFDFEITQTANYIFYTADERGVDIRDTSVSVWKCDGKEIQQFVTRGQMEQAIQRAKKMESGDKIDIYEIDHIFAQDDRCYIQMELGWQDGKTYRMEYLLFSQGEDESELRYEKELTEKMQSCTKSRSGVWADFGDDGEIYDTYLKHVVVNDAHCFYMMDGYLYLSIYDFKKDKTRIERYGLHTGEIHPVSKHEARYGELGFSGVYDEIRLDEIFEDGESSWEIGFNIVPTKDEEEDGAFYETGK